VHVARDGRDAFLSWHNHVSGFTPEIAAKVGGIVANDPELIAAMMAAGASPPSGPPPEDPHLFFQGWIAAAEAPASKGIGTDASYFDFETTYWAERHRPNLLMVHYADMKADLPGEMARIADFLEIEVKPAKLLELAAAAQFEAMKKQGAELLPEIGHHFDKGAERFLNKGVNGRWKDVLTEADLARYDAVAKAKLTPALAAWLEKGRRGAGDPRAAAD
jgi:aryl sulfotransferase